jgi:hypothetical protein
MFRQMIVAALIVSSIYSTVKGSGERIYYIMTKYNLKLTWRAIKQKCMESEDKCANGKAEFRESI